MAEKIEMKLDMVFFDMGGTLDLYPNDSEATDISCRKMTDILIKAGVKEIADYSNDEFRDKVLDGISRYKKWRFKGFIELTPEELWKDFILDDIQISQAVLDNVAEDLTFLIDTGFVKRRARPETSEVLEAIRKKNIRMGIISNVLSRGQVAYSMDEYGITDYFDTVILSAEFGRRKPHPEIFYYACKKASVNPENVLYIGNSPSKDIKGAKDSGIGCTVLIDYEYNSPKDIGPEADYRVSDLWGLVPVIDEICGEPVKA